MESNVYIDTVVSTEEFYKYERSIQVRLDGFSFSIIDGTKEVPSIIAYGEEMVVATPLPLLSVELERWIQTLPFLNDEFKRTTIVFDLDRVITLPVDLFNPDDVSSYCCLHFPDFNEQMDYCVWSQPYGSRWGSLFVIPISIVDVLKHYFEEVHLVHSQTVMYQMKRYLPLQSAPIVLVAKRRSSMDVMVFDDHQELKFVNRFVINGTMDIPYYIISAIDSLSLKVEKVDVLIMGDANPKEEGVLFLQMQCNNIRFFNGGIRFDGLNYFDDSPDYVRMPFLSVFRCEL